jgi:hypothetical protein
MWNVPVRAFASATGLNLNNAHTVPFVGLEARALGKQVCSSGIRGIGK